MNQNNYFYIKEDQNIDQYNLNIDRMQSKEKKSNIKSTKNDSFLGKESINEVFPPINKDSFIKGLSLVFVYFSIIIYSLLYMLTPEKTANIIFEGDSNSISYNYSIYNANNTFYKIDSIRVRENITFLGISQDFRYENKNKLYIEIYFTKNPKIINKVILINKYKSKEIDIGLKIYDNYKVNDFPFWLVLYNNKDIMNITSDELNNFFF